MDREVEIIKRRVPDIDESLAVALAETMSIALSQYSSLRAWRRPYDWARLKVLGARTPDEGGRRHAGGGLSTANVGRSRLVVLPARQSSTAWSNTLGLSMTS